MEPFNTAAINYQHSIITQSSRPHYLIMELEFTSVVGIPRVEIALLPVCLSSTELPGKGSKLVAKNKPFDDEEVGSEESNELPFNSKDQGWSEWSAWTSCSRSCNGGVSYQIRKCEGKSDCEGETTKYKICNMQVSH
ncbi:hypothetical protein NPIL_91161 [Nephila pilipes]|uniref:Uncharacterized protein n=1 Tax=Nephila pilipes TaxID=299642 RepID=A0A8X6U3X8_NEPPI|nr:hypothetical protein NPIL_91161 [Nephila pilipes]